MYNSSNLFATNIHATEIHTTGNIDVSGNIDISGNLIANNGLFKNNITVSNGTTGKICLGTTCITKELINRLLLNPTQYITTLTVATYGVSPLKDPSGNQYLSTEWKIIMFYNGVPGRVYPLKFFIGTNDNYIWVANGAINITADFSGLAAFTLIPIALTTNYNPNNFLVLNKGPPSGYPTNDTVKDTNGWASWAYRASFTHAMIGDEKDNGMVIPV
jgi:hypothetical protein